MTTTAAVTNGATTAAVTNGATTAATTMTTTAAPSTPVSPAPGTAGSMPATASPTTGTGTGHAEHSTSGAPAGIRPATDATYPVGTQVRVQTDHMPGMSGADGKVAGAYATTTYVVDYQPTTGGAMVRDHKWVVQEEIRGAGTRTLPKESKVTLTADHMPGMEGAQATIVSSTTQPVYMIDYTPTTGGPLVRNHKWVVQDELAPL